MLTLMPGQLALRDYEWATRQVIWRDLLSWLTRTCNDLLSFDRVCQNLPLAGEHYLGLQLVPLDKIVGSTGRSHDFDRAFFPRSPHLRERWLNIGKAYHENLSLPPVELLKLGELYFVSDGNHRVSVARARQQKFVNAEVTELQLSVSSVLHPFPHLTVAPV